MTKPTIKELVERFKPTHAEAFVDEIIANWPTYAPMRSFLIDVVNREIHKKGAIGDGYQDRRRG